MKIETIARYGIPNEVIKRWRSDGVRQLLPIQIESVTKHGLLNGDSLVISGPGTSGKTFCGEMAALTQASSRRKAVFVVPLKSIAVEKYKTFQKRYAPLGLKIRIATRDHNDHEKEITKGEFDILITIYEKLNSLTSTDITIIKNVGCFILDEFQMISDPQRGTELELIISKIRRFNPGAQLVLFMGGNSSPGKLSEWRGINVLEENRRPVDLRLGVLFRGTFHFRGYNDHTEGDERWLEERSVDDGPGLDPQALSAVKLLSERGERIIIFMSTKNNAKAAAEYLSSSLELRPSGESLKLLEDLPPSIQKESLGKCLHGGTAFHHAELDQDQRELVETGFRSGDIKLLTSTTTLAWGVNLPAKNVFIESMKYSGEKSAWCKETLIPLSSMDYFQAAGRAGRVGMGESFGRAVLTASTPFEHEILWDNYIYGQPQKLTPRLSPELMPELIIKLISCGAAGSIESLSENVGKMFGAFDPAPAMELDGSIKMAVEFLRENGLIANDICGLLTVSDLGRIAASNGVSVESILKISKKALNDELTEPLEWLYFALNLREWRQNGNGYFFRRKIDFTVIDRINELSSDIISGSPYLEAERNRALQSNSNNFLPFLFALEWISGRPMREMEKAFRRGSGGIRQDVNTLCWLLYVIARVQRIYRRDSEPHDSDDGISKLALRIKHGLPENKIRFSEFLGIDREFVLRLDDFGISNIEDLIMADRTVLREILPDSVAEKIVAKLEKPAEKKKSHKRRIKPKNDNDLVFTGKNRGLQREVAFHGRSTFLQPKLYAYLQKLWWASRTENPWVFKESLEPGINQAKYISKLRKAFAESDINLAIESDGRGFYRLMLPESENRPLVVGDK